MKCAAALVLVVAVLLARKTSAQESKRSELLQQERDRLTCSVAAAVKFGVPANIILAVAELESGRPGQWVKNKNGSFDIGPLQFNTVYLRDLARFGITAADVAAAGCYAYELAAWRLSRHLQRDPGDIWTRAANYHSRTPKHNAKYRARLITRAARWASWLEARFKTAEFAVASAPVPSNEPPARATAMPDSKSIDQFTTPKPRRRSTTAQIEESRTRARGSERERLSSDEVRALHAVAFDISDLVAAPPPGTLHWESSIP